MDHSGMPKFSWRNLWLSNCKIHEFSPIERVLLYGRLFWQRGEEVYLHPILKIIDCLAESACKPPLWLITYHAHSDGLSAVAGWPSMVTVLQITDVIADNHPFSLFQILAADVENLIWWFHLMHCLGPFTYQNSRNLPVNCVWVWQDDIHMY